MKFKNARQRKKVMAMINNKVHNKIENPLKRLAYPDEINPYVKGTPLSFELGFRAKYNTKLYKHIGSQK